MCSRYSLTSYLEGLQEYFDVEFPEAYKPRYNIAPQQESLIIASEQPRKAVNARFGLVPHWSKDPTKFYINARSETLAQKPAFKGSFQKKRCLVIADGFYEWKATPAGKQPYRFTLPEGQVFVFAGLYDEYKNKTNNFSSYCIITTRPNDIVKSVHDRMPVILNKQDMHKWLAGIPSIEHLKLLQPYAQRMESYPVSKALNVPTREGPELIKPVPLQGEGQRSLGDW